MERSENTSGLRRPEGRLRVLIQTRTHLVPGKGRDEKLDYIRNIACQHLWKRDFDWTQERCYPHNDLFGLADRECFFLIHHFGHDHTAQDEQIPLPLLWFQWTGESLIQFSEPPPQTIQEELKKWPFTWEGRKWHRIPKEPDGTYSPVNYRNLIRSYLRLGVPVLDDQIKFVREYPEHARWLKDHLEEHLWLMLEPYCDLGSDVENGDLDALSRGQ